MNIRPLSLHGTCALAAFVFSQFVFHGNALSSVVDEWAEGLGQTPNAVHSFLFEVTIMNIDVAIIEYQLDEETAALASAITHEGTLDDARRDQVGEVFQAATTIAFSMDLQRDASCNRLLKGMLGNLKRAAKSGLVSDAEHDLVNKRLQALLAPHEERGVYEGDLLMYRVQPEGVRVLLLGVDGELLVDSFETGPAWTKGIKGIFLGPDSKLRDNLIEAAWEKPVQGQIIENSYPAPVKRVIEMEEVWRVGDNPDEDFILGVIKKVISDQEGNYYFLDTQQSEVFKFSPEGQYLKSVSRKGEGPGELGRCYFFGFWDKNTIACFSNFPHKFVRFDLEGIPAETLTPSPGEAQKNDGRMAMSAFIRRDGFLVAHGSFHLFEEGGITQKFFLSGFNDNAEETICYGKVLTGYDRSKPIVIDEEADFIPQRRWTLGNNGEVYTAPHRTEYLIEVHDSQGTLIRTITREWELHKRSDEEKEAAKNRYTFGVSGRVMPQISYKMSDYARTINSLSWVDGQLWVTSSEGVQAALAGGTFVVDVFDSEGLLLEERSYVLPMNPDNDKVNWLDGGRAVVVKNYTSAKVASRSVNTSVQRGEGKHELTGDDGGILEVILYQTKN